MTRASGRLLGAHQKIDRVARRHLKQLAPHIYFPHIRGILHFEGVKGPDAIKRKSPARDEPWHYLQPFDLEDKQLIELIESHYNLLVAALRKRDTVRAGYEAAWLAHAVVDGLTPAHHYPYGEKLIELRGGESLESRDTVFKKLVLPGDNLGHQISNNWQMWGARGLLTTHALFEWGIAILIAPSHLKWKAPTDDKIQAFAAQPLGQWYRSLAQDIARMNYYDDYYKTGWTLPLARRVRNRLVPTLMQAVTTIWHGAAREAGVLELGR
ncbi:MAG: hypothetical protein ABIV43_02495 [Candidatus Saccharimonadales bacterium]